MGQSDAELRKEFEQAEAQLVAKQLLADLIEKELPQFRADELKEEVHAEFFPAFVKSARGKDDGWGRVVSDFVITQEWAMKMLKNQEKFELKYHTGYYTRVVGGSQTFYNNDAGRITPEQYNGYYYKPDDKEENYPQLLTLTTSTFSKLENARVIGLEIYPNREKYNSKIAEFTKFTVLIECINYYASGSGYYETTETSITHYRIKVNSPNDILCKYFSKE